jgi:hypothetical protein
MVTTSKLHIVDLAGSERIFRNDEADYREGQIKRTRQVESRQSGVRWCPTVYVCLCVFARFYVFAGREVHQLVPALPRANNHGASVIPDCRCCSLWQDQDSEVQQGSSPEEQGWYQ